jgi:site-specific DNA-methyltransferase (adenine-specific)
MYKGFKDKYESGSITIYNDDCMNILSQTPDNYYQLCVVDPPYGIDAANTFGGNERKSGKGAAMKTAFAKKDWDLGIPDQEYFNELMRVSENQIVWGANYMSHFLPPSMGWIVWDKDNGTTKFSDAELAFSSFDRALRLYKYTWNGMIQGDMKKKESRIHPTQKPVKLYEWLLKNYAKEGDKILDTHLGSGSSAIAAHYGGFDFVGCELDEDYFKAARARIEQETKQQDMF